MNTPTTINELINRPDYHAFPSSSDEWLNDPERMARVSNAAAYGIDGSTHAETLEDWREFARQIYRDAPRAADTEEEEEALEQALELALETLLDEIDACEQYHEEHGTLHLCVGGEDPDSFDDEEGED